MYRWTRKGPAQCRPRNPGTSRTSLRTRRSRTPDWNSQVCTVRRCMLHRRSRTGIPRQKETRCRRRCIGGPRRRRILRNPECRWECPIQCRHRVENRRLRKPRRQQRPRAARETVVGIPVASVSLSSKTLAQECPIYAPLAPTSTLTSLSRIACTSVSSNSGTTSKSPLKESVESE
jgi:hypothetical protein